MPETLWQEWYAALPVGRITGTALRRLILEGNLIRPIQGSGDLPEFVGIDRELMETVVQRSREAVERTLEYYKKVDAAQLFSIELHVAPIFYVLKMDMSMLEASPELPPGQVVYPRYDKRVATGSYEVLQPHEVFRSFSLEWLNLPPGCAGEISPRTSIGRQGIQVTLLPAVDPGVSGCISLQLINHNQCALPLILEQPCCKLALHKLPDTPHDGAHWLGFGAPVKTGKVSKVKVLSSKGLANHTDPESCVRPSNRLDEALTGERVGRVLSRENTNTRTERRRCRSAGRQHCAGRYRKIGVGTARSETPGMHGNTLRGSRESPCSPDERDGTSGRIRKSEDAR